MGAYDGESYSNTSGLADVGWRGFCIEPVPAHAERCDARHARNGGVTVACTAIGDTVGEVEIALGGAYSTASAETAVEYSAVRWASHHLSEDRLRVPQTTLDRFLAEHGVAPGFELLSVDVEGYEAQVFAGFDLERWRPQLLIVELCDTHPDLVGTRRSDAGLGRRIEAAGYVIVFKDQVNTVFVREQCFRLAYRL